MTLVRICRRVTDSRLAPSRLKMRHSRNGPSAEFRAFFGCDVEFGADSDAVSFPAPLASLPVVGRDEYLNELLRRYAEEALERSPRARSTVRSKVEDILPGLLPHGRAVASEVAPRLGMSSRSLSRKLGEEGTSFAEILDQFRAALAKRYLNDETLPVSEIAWLLGYREASSLTNAFKRWTGTTSRQFRSRQSGPASTKLIAIASSLLRLWRRYRRPSRRGWRDVTKPWRTITRRQRPAIARRTLNRSWRSGSQSGRLMTSCEDLLFVVSVVWFVTLCGAVGWLLIAG